MSAGREQFARKLIYLLGMSVRNGETIIRGEPNEAQREGLKEYAAEIREILYAPKVVTFCPRPR